VVVVVDDDPGYLKALVLTIERSDLDLEVVEAATGVDALLEIGRVQPSLIVLDYSLPDLNASQVIQRLLEPGRRLDAEVMVVTGGMPAEAGVQLRQMGVKVILNKSEGMRRWWRRCGKRCGGARRRRLHNGLKVFFGCVGPVGSRRAI